VWAQLGKTWQPFGGAGYFVLIVLLVFAIVSASVLIVLPLAVRGVWRVECGVKGASRFTFHASRTLVYFAWLGFGFLFIEIPLVQRLILFVGKPVYALAVVLFGLLLFSGLGSVISRRAPWRGTLAILMVVALAYPMLLPRVFQLALGWPLAARFAVGVMSLAPLGVDGNPVSQGHCMARTFVAQSHPVGGGCERRGVRRRFGAGRARRAFSGVYSGAGRRCNLLRRGNGSHQGLISSLASNPAVPSVPPWNSRPCYTTCWQFVPKRLLTKM
jgi:hypothetical protein